MSNPYVDLPSRAYWKQAVGTRNFLEIDALWTPKFAIAKTDKIITAGSCFAQHISRAMQGSGYAWMDYEPAPNYLLHDQRQLLNYGVYSFRTSNIYTVRALRQWIDWALRGEAAIAEKSWPDNGRFLDPFRPAIERGGFESEAELIASRETTLRAIKAAITDASVFVFTLGLTESWRNRKTGETYAMCPGTIGGRFDASLHEFVNSDYAEILADAEWVLASLRRVNPQLRVLLTVSPVPLTATASGDHVLPATIYSKSVLRAVAGKLAGSHAHVDYFPSYEIVSAFPYRGAFFEANQRSVAHTGVAHVMRQFLAALAPGENAASSGDARPATPEKDPQPDMNADDALVCEELFLDRQ
ncbi:MAG: GSCFA domain-containing protein [Paracoccaceae bacterium]|nr:GSCFA domain-containing protein [Paracoccaceae bacterium]